MPRLVSGVGHKMLLVSRLRAEGFMGFDFQLIAYQGDSLKDEQVAKLLLEIAPSGGRFRHGPAREGHLDDLHCVALYEEPSARSPSIVFTRSTALLGQQEGASLSTLV